MSAEELAQLFNKLPSRDQRVIGKIMERMVEWDISFARAIANATVFFQPGGGDQESEDFEKSLDWWIDAGIRYG